MNLTQAIQKAVNSPDRHLNITTSGTANIHAMLSEYAAVNEWKIITATGTAHTLEQVGEPAGSDPLTLIPHFQHEPTILHIPHPEPDNTDTLSLIHLHLYPDHFDTTQTLLVTTLTPAMRDQWARSPERDLFAHAITWHTK